MNLCGQALGSATSAEAVGIPSDQPIGWDPDGWQALRLHQALSHARESSSLELLVAAGQEDPEFGPRTILVVNRRSVALAFAEASPLVRFVSDAGPLAADDLWRSTTLCN